MSSNPELMRVEESVKEKYIELVKNISYLELKKFNKVEYAAMVLADMIKLLPDFDKSQLKETSHYVSNALNNEAQHQLKMKSRGPASSRDKGSNLLSSTVLEDLESTMRTDCCANTISDYDDSIDDNDDSNLSTSTIDATIQLDDSQTKQKQAVNTESMAPEITGKSNTKSNDNNKDSKCCDSCKVTPKTKKKYEMIRCSLCMSCVCA